MNYIEVDLEKKESLVEMSLINTSVAGLQAHICYNQEYSHNIFESIWNPLTGLIWKCDIGDLLFWFIHLGKKTVVVRSVNILHTGCWNLVEYLLLAEMMLDWELMSGILELQLFGNPSEQTHWTLTIYSDSSELHKKEKRKKKKKEEA